MNTQANSHGAPRRIVILGSTGSIGRSALDVVRAHRERFEVVGLAAGSNAQLLAEQIAEFRPKVAALQHTAAAQAIQTDGAGTKLLTGDAGVADVAGCGADVVLCGVVGAAGLEGVLRAIDSGATIALANKEPLVMAGGLIMARARERGVQVLPVDSEHNALFQCLEGRRLEEVRTVYLTASGGPLYRKDPMTFDAMTPEQAIKHPTWDMGAKISVDSATLMNKGLEVIEAMHLFNLPLEKLQVIIHPQSLVHGLVEFIDGHFLAHIGVTDMKLPIQFALTWPERVECPVKRLNLAAMGAITFDDPDFEAFPCLTCAFEAARRGGSVPAALNAANEEAVAAFRAGRITFTGIGAVVREVLDATSDGAANSLDAVRAADADARLRAQRAIQRSGVPSV